MLTAACAVLSLSGCTGSDKAYGGSDFVGGNPAYSMCQVMETENGYYNTAMGLAYYDKATGKSLYLCSKPECVHDGSEYCTATFGDMYISSSYEYVIKSEDGIESIFSRIENALSCPVKDIIDGNVNWTEAFSFAEMHQDRINDVLEHIEQMEEENAGA